MVIDLELTLNRFGFERVAANKLQLGCFRLAWWHIPSKHSISVEVNWSTSSGGPSRNQWDAHCVDHGGIAFKSDCVVCARELPWE